MGNGEIELPPSLTPRRQSRGSDLPPDAGCGCAVGEQGEEVHVPPITGT
jgi:hypothetical protein